ncbi:competence protein ComK [Scopulibacillus darangshiensis]|uniref:Competence protein ComK n=1 Tax=Scopulibacillus darangshiensis TaxID=442528 RepID=A0A4R2NEP1_9BACL|nr:competence protein ComK [Scopulibacillus darangshiensis]TCP19707.1 competence protein ComK [Scopulibacillus darangshiensis]
MTNNVVNDYEISKNTMALIPAFQFDCETIVIERDRRIHVKKTPLELVKAACLDGGSTYDGRRLAVIHQTGASKKTPIPINPLQDIYAFPTHSPLVHQCNWIFYHHVGSIDHDTSTPGKSIITFKKSTQTLLLDTSEFTLNKQMHRTSYCIVLFSGRHTISRPQWDNDLYG